MESTVVALVNSWQEMDYILYKASFMGLSESEVSILTPKTTAVNGKDPQLTSPGARYLGMTEGVPLKIGGLEFTAYGDWSLMPLSPGKPAGFDALLATFRHPGLSGATTGRLVHGLKKGRILLFITSYTKDMAGKISDMLKDVLVLDSRPSHEQDQVALFREQGCF